MVRVRVAALALRDGEVLLARHVKSGRVAYLLPGGGVQTMEATREALVREMREEAAVACQVGNLRYVVETRAPAPARHLVQLVFDVAVLGEIGPSSDTRVAECAWHPIAALRTLPFRPDVGAEIAADLERGASGLRYVLARWHEA